MVLLFRGGIAYVIQRQNSKSAIKLETEKHKINVISSYLLSDLIDFLNDEVANLQSVYLSPKDGSNIPAPEHHRNLINTEINVRAFQDEGLKNLFDEFVTAGNKVRKLTAVEKAIGDDDILWAAVDLAAGIKKRALELSQFNIK
ncbi:hypothetical protein [Salmonella enterica]|uniref:hypothetical protein n=1 Tax=Salmonella enterica TaxID=28901 RepID=UPI001161A4E5|nr:hypothetical protein [Salmonella enterica]ECM0290674.1 hypothetical protein [Salmonella enterica subsp. enterica serovar Agona]EDG3769721.1 hypothetical protein [Salmonella enterica subsp. enterica serovar Newport]EAT7977346.1 hypothetical protein [Salmonella enterica]EAW4386988.1 hypothetical protein [Salmonella enterica]EBC2565175.1 hypothetical protein [Salmonella enterica]